ncbi:MAG: hypothetical protein ACXAAP_01025, partial [Candidatus Thorarchaeota archaeon]
SRVFWVFECPLASPIISLQSLLISRAAIELLVTFVFHYITAHEVTESWDAFGGTRSRGRT